MKNKGILYVTENFTSFNLMCDGEVIDDDFQDITLDNQYGLRCAKCDKSLTLEEYKSGKLQETTDSRKVNGTKYNELSMNFKGG